MKEKHATVVIGMVDSVDEMKKERDDAVKKLAAAVEEGKVFKDCLEGKFGASTSKAEVESKSKLCSPCSKIYTAKIETLKKTHTEEVAKLQKSVKQWTAKFDARLEANTLSHRFCDREKELRQRIEFLDLELRRARTEIKEKRANFDTHMVSTLKHKGLAKELLAIKPQFALAIARVAELEKSVMQVG